MPEEHKHPLKSLLLMLFRNWKINLQSSLNYSNFSTMTNNIRIRIMYERVIVYILDMETIVP
mgnify:CR=1 FL=1